MHNLKTWDHRDNNLSQYLKPANLIVFLIIVVILSLQYSVLIYTEVGTKESQDISSQYINHAPVNLVVIGDSLFNRPFTPGSQCQYNGAYCDCYSDLGGMINNKTERPMSITNFCADGSTIADVQRNQLSSALRLHPDAIILIWDSDASSNPTITGAPDLAFNQTLAATINAILAKRIRLAVASPGLLGENELVMFHPASSSIKLNNYRVVTQAITSAFGVPYLDMRQAFLNEIHAVGFCTVNYAKLCVKASPVGVFGQVCGAGVVTADGEHLNKRGAELIAALLSEQLNRWFPSVSSSPPRSKRFPKPQRSGNRRRSPPVTGSGNKPIN